MMHVSDSHIVELVSIKIPLFVDDSFSIAFVATPNQVFIDTQSFLVVNDQAYPK